MLIIVEGQDGTGKSTLCNQLKKRGFKTIRRTRDSINFTFIEMNHLAKQYEPVVFDRAIFTPWAYRLFDGESLDIDDFTWSQIQILLKNAKVIMCENKDCFEISRKRGEDNITTVTEANALGMIYKFITRTLQLYNVCPVMEYNFETNTVDDVINFIKGGNTNGVR